MKLLSYEFDKEKLMINFDSSFSKIQIQKIESPTIIHKEKGLNLDCDVIHFTFSKPKSTLLLWLSQDTQVVIIIIGEVDGEHKNKAMMFYKQVGDNEEIILAKERGNGLEMRTGTKKPKPFKKNEYQHIYATIRRKVKNGDRQTISKVQSDMCIV
jgi:hypothetical protein